MNAQLLRSEPALSAITENLDDEAVLRVATAAALANDVRQVNKFSVFFGFAAGVLIAALAVPVLVPMLAGPGLAPLTGTRYGLGFCWCLLAAAVIALIERGLIGGLYVPEIASRRRRVVARLKGSSLPILVYGVFILIAWDALNRTYGVDSSVYSGPAWVFLVIFTGIPLMAILIIAGRTAGPIVAEFFHEITCWDALLVDLFELAVAERYPGQHLELDNARSNPPRSLRSQPKSTIARILNTVRQRLVVELVEEVAGRTVTNFARVFWLNPNGADPVTVAAMTQRGAGIAASLRTLKLAELIPGYAQQQSALEKFRAASQLQWDKITEPGEYVVKRTWWRRIVARVSVIAAVLAAAWLAPLVINGPTGLSLRASLIVLAIAAVFSPPGTTGERAYEVLKTTTTAAKG